MPTYEYECNACGHIVDVFHKMTERPRVKCPVCGKGTRKKIGAGAGIIFKGSGFYETDYKKKSNHRETTPEKSAAESKPAERKKEEKKSEEPKGD